ncbi:esterase/lipase family protein [Kineosporia babensis]|uniref:DUF7379 domain-containing protein n=1 Tax=Kineosporia babensis TaxID=499548 RepID=A0A9X1SUD8_9ACTN|nr:hypothetical protein [Kineosporia babensis]MCD5312341.1 hypothetical protein [Kineosporia babensis]
MAQALNPDGTPVTIDGVVLSTPGLSGQAEVLPAGAPGLRMREGTADAFTGALASAGFMEQLTVEISEHTEVAQVGGLRGGGGPEISVTVPGPGRYFAQVLLYTAEDGSQSWHLPIESQAVAAVGPQDQASLTYVVPRAVQPTESGAPAYRGLIWALGRKLLKVLAFPLLERGTAVVADRLATRWEAEHRPYLLRTFTPDDYSHTEGRGLDAQDWARFAEGPALLFLHGTFSRSDLAFRELPAQRLHELHELYGGRVFAFDHPTLSADPAANARELVTRLPGSTRLTVDVIAHSRGGLVGRELAQVGGGAPTVRRLVMVGTPNAGTVLADSKHWGALIDRMTNLLQFVPDNPVTDTLDAVLTVLKHLALGAVRGLDGLSAMDPAGTYLRERLNRPLATDQQAPPVLRAIASDYDPPAESPLARVSRNGLTDLVFGRDGNDLVVPTQGVYRLDGVPGFPVPEPLLLEPHAGVEHTRYFADPLVGEKLLTWLR